MTKEELKKEAKSYAKRKFNDEEQAYLHDIIAQTYYDGSEPREKRIKELEQQIEKMKVCCNCDWSNYLPNGNCLDCDGKKNWKLKEKRK